MKKVLMVIICLLLFVGCSNDNFTTKKHDISKNKAVAKIDKNKPYVIENNKDYILSDNSNFILKNIKINLNTDDASNINMILKTNYMNCINDLEYEEDKIIKGTLINYDYYISDSYISIVESKNSYYYGNYGETVYNVYTIFIKEGRSLNSDDLLIKFNLSTEDLFSNIRNNVVSDDVEFTIMNIRHEGYSLYVNNDGELVVIYNEVTDDDIEKKELILND